jgi:hypothetical protein
MPKWSWVGLLGVALVAPAALYWAWIWISDPVRPADVGVAFQRLLAVPLSRADGDRSVEVTVTTPNDASWRRIIRNWGDPGYFIGAVSPGPRHYMYCLDDLGIHVKVTTGDRPVSLETADVPYGYSVECRPAGLVFKVPPGTAFKIRMAVAGHPRQTADLVVEPYWTVGTKDRLVGIGIEEQLHLSVLASALGAAGTIMIAIAILLFLYRPVRLAR